MLNIKGVDISNYDGIFDFGCLNENGIEACIIESGDGVTFTNPYLEEQYIGIKNANIKVGFYHFFRAEDDYIIQAQAFWNRIKDKEFNIIPVVDVEVTMGISNLSEVLVKFIDYFKEISGYECIIYTYVNFANTYLDSQIGSYKCWIAEYGTSSISKTIFENYVGWQYTDSGSIRGINDTFDLDKFSDEIFISKKEKIQKELFLWQECVSGQIIKNLQYELDIQFSKDLVVDGLFGEKTLGACINIGFGAEGEITKIMQERLIDKGFSCGTCEADGIFGEDTLRAVLKFQRYMNLNPNGICNKEAWKELMLK
ncbi:MAG: GH25 family lysozyme [Clostridium sp.]|uniref:GH25 family lysozyme n=1 Tax=Clostridium sp. TaxID=1506 RepID=UPI003EE55B7F